MTDEEPPREFKQWKSFWKTARYTGALLMAISIVPFIQLKVQIAMTFAIVGWTLYQGGTEKSREYSYFDPD